MDVQKPIPTSTGDMIKTLLIVGAIILFILLLVALYSWFSTKSERDTLQVELDSIKKELQTAKQNLSTCSDTDRPALLLKIDELNNKIDQYKALVSAVNSVITVNVANKNPTTPSDITLYTTKLETQLRTLLNNATVLQNNTAEQQSALSDLLRTYVTFTAIKQKIDLLNDSYSSLKNLATALTIPMPTSPNTSQDVFMSPNGPVFTSVGDSVIKNDQNLNNIGNYISGTRDLAITMGATGPTSFNDLKNRFISYQSLTGAYSTLNTNYQSLTGAYSTLNTNYQSLTGAYSTLNTNYDTMNYNYNMLTNSIQNQIAAYNDNEATTAFSDTGNMFSNDIGTARILRDNNGVIDQTKLSNFIKYIRSALYLVGQMNRTLNGSDNTVTFRSLLDKYNVKLAEITNLQSQVSNLQSQVNILQPIQRYQSQIISRNNNTITKNVIPVRFLRDTVLFKVNGGDAIGESFEFPYYEDIFTGVVRPQLLDKCTNSRTCISMLFSDSEKYKFDSTVASRRFNKNDFDGNTEYPFQINGVDVSQDFVATRIISAKMVTIGTTTDLLKTGVNGVNYFNPLEAVGGSTVTFNKLLSISDNLDWSYFIITVAGMTRGGFQLRSKNAQGKNPIRFVDDNLTTVLVKPEAYDWSGMTIDYNAVDNTIDLMKLNKNGGGGILFRKVYMVSGNQINPENNQVNYFTSLQECLDSAYATSATNNINSPVGILINQTESGDDGKFWCRFINPPSTGGNVKLSRRISDSLQWDFYLLPGKSNIELDF